MPVLTVHWDVLKENGLFRKEAGEGSTVRFPVLMSLVGRANNTRLRCWPSVNRMMTDLCISDKHVMAGALEWLADHGAIYKVPIEKRVDEEKRLLPQKYVFQLTGIIELDGKVMKYILMNLEERETMIANLAALGADYAISLYGILNSDEPKPESDLEGEDRVSVDSYINVGVESTSYDGVDSTPLSSTLLSSTKKAIPPPATQSGQRYGPAILNLQVNDPISPTKDGSGDRKSSLLADYLEATTVKQLTKEQRDRLAQPVIYSTHDVKKKYKSPDILYADVKSGFSHFVMGRLEAHQALGEYDLKFIVGDICNYKRNKPGGQPGWLAWKDKHAYLTTPPPAGSDVPLHQQRVVMALEWDDVPTIDLSLFEDVPLPPRKAKTQ